VVWSGKPRPGYRASADLTQLPDEATRTKGIEYWKKWFEQRFHQKFVPVFEKAETEKSDEEVYKFLLADSFNGGDPARGARVYASLRCNTCHGDGAHTGATNRLFGPDLAGVVQRLSRAELADALVYPSRQVAGRFKAVAITLKDSTVLKGYITEQNDDSITLAGRAKVRRLDRSTVGSVEPQAESLMPGRSLNRASWEEIRDLMKFLDRATETHP
jgi:putative heme-binding domain-containing protein